MSPGRMAAAVVAAAIAAAAVWWRRGGRIGNERLLAALVLAAALGVYASGLLSELPDPKKVIGHVAQALGPWTYALVGVLAFLETGAFVGLVAPGETVVIAGGVIAGQGEIDLLPLVGLVWACAVLGDTTSFFIGRRLGRRFLERHGPRLRIDEERLRQVEGYFQRHGGKTILIGRFIGLVRALAPFVAGSSGMAYASFIPFSIIGTGLWATTFCLLGYVFWQSFEQVAHLAGQALFGFGVTVAVIVGVVVAYRRLRDPEQRRRLRHWVARQERRPLARPLLAVARPVWRRALRPAVRLAAPRLRFLSERLTPGGLGIELTTALAVAGVGGYVFVLYTVVLSGDAGATPLDRELLDLGERVRASALIDGAKLVTDLGAFPTVAVAVAATAGLLAVRGRVPELLALLAGFALVYVAVQAAKAGIDRPRPEGGLVATRGSSFPSGHAAYSTGWVAMALVLTRRLGLAAALLTAALVVCAAVGLSRIYLGVHYFSDTAGGWALGFCVFALCATVALVVEHFRQNEAERWTSTSQPPSSHSGSPRA